MPVTESGVWEWGTRPEELLAGLRDPRPDAVFNLYEGAGDYTITECYVAGLLDWLHLPFTGCPFQTLVYARSKHLTKHLFRGEGLPTAPFLVVEELPLPSCGLSWPVICKPAQQDASIGVDQSCVVTNLDALNARLNQMAHDFGFPILVEEFIMGREMTVALVEMPGLRVLPITEAMFPSGVPGYWPILSYDAKWNTESHEYNATDYRFGVEVSSELAGHWRPWPGRPSASWASRLCPGRFPDSKWRRTVPAGAEPQPQFQSRQGPGE